MHTPLIIIGAGPGGYETALLAAKRGLEVTLIEKGNVGGTCLNEGCIPTKSFCRNAQILDELKQADQFGISQLNYSFDFAAVQQRKEQVVSQLRQGVETLLTHKLIHFVSGTAQFVDAHTVCVESTTYSADHIIIATGSSAQMLPIEGADLPQVISSTELIQLTEVPPRLCIIGAGVIGMEFASIFQSFGSEVTVLEYTKEILPRFDVDLAKRLRQSLNKRGIEILTQAAVERIEEGNGELHVHYTRKGKEEYISADRVLMAVGRKPNVDTLNLNEVGISYSARGIQVNENMQTCIPHIYAIGDVTGGLMLAHVATHQGTKALNHLMQIPEQVQLNPAIPAAVFTTPEMATVGLTEEECKERGIEYSVRKSFFRANGKALCMNEPDGICKIIIDAQGFLLGCHIMGAHASDLIQEACSLIALGGTVQQLSSTVHTHPTLNEILQTAAHSS